MMQATGNTMFSPSVHLVLCQNCGAPIEAAVTGGLHGCKYCNAQNRISARVDVLSQPKGPPIPEQERIARLRAQDGRPMLPPASLAGLLADGEIPAWKMQEAMQVWQTTRAELASSNNYEAAERLRMLTMLLANKYAEQNDLVRQRAMFESALDAFSLPRHRQIMRCCLARAAAKMGDMQGAEEWIRSCDPLSDDLESDSEWRLARAVIDTFAGNYQRVLQVLGSTTGMVPIQDAMDEVCAVFRANAWEKMGQLQYAVNVLQERMAQGPHIRAVQMKIVQVYSRWGICAQSFPLADTSHAQVAAGQVGQMSGGMLAMVLIPLGAMFVLMALGCAVGCVFAIISGSYDWLLGPGICMVVMGPLGLGFVYGGFRARAAAKKAAYLRVHGVRANARVLGISGTGMEVNGIPQVMVQLQVELPGQMPYQTSTKLLLSNPGQLAAGGMVAVRVDPKDPATVILEAD